MTTQFVSRGLTVGLTQLPVPVQAAWQAELRRTPLPGNLSFSRSGTADYVNASGLLASAASGAARFDFNPTTLLPQGVLLEGSRTNLVLQSGDISSGSWTFFNGSITANNTVAPDGANTADKFTEDSSTNGHGGFQAFSKAASALTYTASFFAKAGTRSHVWSWVDDGNAGNLVQVGFDLSAGTVYVPPFAGGNFTAGAAHMQALPNGWYRCSYTLTSNTSGFLRYFLFNDNGNGTTSTYNGNGTGSLYLWGMQLEQAAFMGSYIPTTTAAVTRVADMVSTSALNGVGFNPTEGTFVLEGVFAGLDNTTDQVLLQVDDGSESNRLRIGQHSGNMQALVTTGGSAVAMLTPASGLSAGTVYRVAFAYKNGSYAACVNGGAVATASSGTLPAGLTTLRLGSGFSGGNAFGWVKRATCYRERLADAALRSLTI